jgi:hypothetical protein
MSGGRYYDQIALLFLGDTEIWRTSTATPTEHGIYWSSERCDGLRHFLRTEQKVSLDLSNVYLDLLAEAHNVPLEALYYNDIYLSKLRAADDIFPISALGSAQNIPSVMSL